MRILAIYDGSGPKYHRVLLPVAMLQRSHNVEVLVKQTVVEDDLPGVDIVFFNRLIPGIKLEILLQLREKYGFKLICDLDDHWRLDRSHILYENYRKHNITQKIYDFIESADAVTVTHERLYYEIDNNCHILPNAIPAIDQFLVNKTPDDKVRLFWAGGITHRKDLELLRRPLQLLKRDKIKLVMGGYEHGNAEWKEMAKIFTTDSAYNTVVIESKKVHEYYHIYSLCDISLIPLVETSFNTYKSNLKILEAANIGSPVIVSRVHPYLDFPEDLVNYVDAYNPWFKQINKLVNDPVLRMEQGLRLKEYCAEHFNFNKINEERKQIFDATIQHRQTSEVQAEAGSMA